jgi:hypothetical protein
MKTTIGVLTFMKNKLDLTKFKISSIGTTVGSSDKDLLVEIQYSSISWFFITFFGTTRVPKEINFTCIKTNEKFESLTNKDLMVHYMTYTTK